MSPRPISHYQILDKLGEGGMGVVWKARDSRLNRLVAIKTLRADKMADADRKRRFIQEAQAASALNHPNIVTIHDIASENGTDFIVMEYVEGKTLGQLIPRRGMRLDEILRHAIQIAEALAKAHAAGIVHRDLKPGNIMVTPEGRVKLLDFGLAKLTEPAEPGEDERTHTMAPQSEEGSIVGTAAYMSPEQAESKPVDARSDIFSFGAVLYEMATGQRAFQGDSKLSTLSAVLRENPKPPSQVVSEIPRELDRIVSRCLRKDPARRFQATPDLKVALEELKEESDSGTAEMPGTPSPRKKRLFLPAMAAGTVLAAGAVWFFLHPADKTLPPPHSVPLTTYPGTENYPTFSPDGSQIAFTWNGEKRDNADIYVKLVDGGPPLRLTTNPAPDYGAAWSPDGRQIAFQRGRIGVYSISPLGGPERKLADGDGNGLAWTPDGQSLLISLARNERELHSICQLSMRTGEMRQLTSPPPQGQPGAGDLFPAVSPDGQTLAFYRYNGSSGDIYAQPLHGGNALRVTKVKQVYLWGVAWANNREILFCNGVFGTGGLWRIPADGRSEPEHVAGALDGAIFPAVFHPAKGSARLAYGLVTNDSNIWRMEVAVDAGARVRTVAEPAAVIASTRADITPQLSPDGSRLAFSSDRDGYREIWASAADGSGQAQLTTLKSTRCSSPKWSPDGRQIVFDSLASGNNDIWIVGSEGGPPKRATTEPSDDARPAWSRDGRWIYFRSDRSGARQIWKIPAAEPFKPAVQVTRNGGFDALDSVDGKTLYYTKESRGLWSLNLESGEETDLGLPVVAGNWAVAADAIWFLDTSHRAPDRMVPLQWFSFRTRKLVQAALLSRVSGGNTPQFSVTPDGRWVAWTQLDHQDADLMMIDNFR